ncbi:hypothetical protein PGR6_35390 [Pseudomonas sp. GR 6-02]|nr:hypothetical protein PGR6_35390 [Pseudomonas sp. GR 6-02]
MMSPLQVVGQGIWLSPLKPCLHLNVATYLVCVESQAW